LERSRFQYSLFFIRYLVRSISPDAHRTPPYLIDPSCVPPQDHGLSSVTDAASGRL